MNPTVTLAVLTLNKPTYLRETLTSVLAQDYPGLEILISDNASTDETPDLAREIAGGDPRVRFRRNEKTVPIHEHFTQCLFAAKGEFFILLSDDDRINPTFVSELAGVARRHPSVNVVVPLNRTIDENGNTIEDRPPLDGEVFPGPEFVCNWLYRRVPPPFAAVVTVMGRTETMRHFGGYQPFARGQNIDNCNFLQLAITGDVGFARNARFEWRVFNRSYGSTATPQQIAESSRAFVKALRTHPQTVAALDRLPAHLRREIIDGVRLMTAEEFLFRIRFYENPFSPRCVSKFPIFGCDRIFLRTIAREYWHRLRRPFSRGRRSAPATA